MSETSRHLRVLADNVQSGAHVVLRGHLGDEVLVDGEIYEELWAVADLLAREVGIEAVLVVNQADGLHCLKPEQDERVAEVLRAEVVNAVVPELGAELGASSPFHISSAIRALLRQEEMAVAIVLQDPAALLGAREEQDQRALGILLEAMAEAGFPNQRGDASVKNVLIVYGSPTSGVSNLVAAVPGVVEQTVDLPDRAERLAALRCLAPGFYGSDGRNSALEDLESLARITHGYSLRGLDQLRRRSHAVATPLSRPESLYRRARRERRGTPINRVGVGTIMAMLEDEIAGQPRAMESIRELLEQGRWRSANRPPGSTVTRPMATMVLHGPTGVGKTETGYILAEAIVGSRNAVRRIDCAEFHQDHDTARLTGAPPGYIGYEDGGVLTEALEEEAAIIVLDEFDRGPPRLTEMLLGILDAGRLTDGRGRTVSFENAILILTTNAGTGPQSSAAGELPGAEEVEELIGESLAPTGSELTVEALPETDDLLTCSAKVLKHKLETASKGGGLGSPALWSRLQDSLVGYDYLRRDALETMVRKSCRHLAANLGDEFDLRISFAVERFVTVISDRLPPDGSWDGRKVAPYINLLLERPVRDSIDQGGLNPCQEVTFIPDEEGLATLR